VAHELGNPIGIIKSCAEYLSGRVNKLDTDDPLKNSVQEEVEVIASESTRCQRILKELLSYSSEEAIAMENVELAGVVRRAEGLVAYKIHSDRIALEADLPEGEVYVRGDTNLLIQALVNILLNAIDSIDGPGRVTVRVRSENAQVIMDIEDTGCGIPPDIQQRIFDPFYTTRDEGTGLGLAITQRIINRLGGTIEVHSQTDKGSLFRLCLPQGEQEESYSPEESALR
jgi:signal transduction histidine kinase